MISKEVIHKKREVICTFIHRVRYLVNLKLLNSDKEKLTICKSLILKRGGLTEYSQTKAHH